MTAQTIATVLLALALLITWGTYALQNRVAPFKNPPDRMAEGAILIWMVMMVRWGLIAASIVATLYVHPFVNLWLALVLHGLLGGLVLWVWNRWISVIYSHTCISLIILVVLYFAIPTLVIAGLLVEVWWT